MAEGFWLFLIYRKIGLQVPAALPLESAETKHVRARRLVGGAEMFLGDGISRRWRGVLSPDRKQFVSDLATTATVREEPELFLCTAQPEGRRWFWLLQKATELGVTEIYPVLYRRSNPGAPSFERGWRVILEAASQARRFSLPKLHSPCALEELPNRLPSGAQPLVLDGQARKSLEHWDLLTGVPTAFAGPEGGFTEEELRWMVDRLGWQRCHLGGNVLRVETAALAALAVLAGKLTAPSSVQ